MAEPDFLDEPPNDAAVTDYDRRHLKLYARLLDAKAAGANWQEVFGILFASGEEVAPDRAKRIHDSHLERAEWMSRTGYQDLTSEARH